jgi:Tol biopolymer transport system component
MEAERWRQVEQLCQAALDRAPSKRAAFLAAACAQDEELRREVESLLAYQAQAEPFIETPALHVAAGLLNGDESQSLVGQSFSHYQVLALLGRGGMGEVYLAQDEQLRRKVALKVLPSAFTQDAERVRRFEQEARAASALNHPNIITIYEIGQAPGVEGGVRYIATEHVDGETLRQKMADSPMELGRALEVITQVTAALAEAHAAGIIHRDIKPENVMVRRDGLVKVLDFGLAKLTARQAETHDSDTPTALQYSTAAGIVMGTARYMSPEQARGLKVDARTDIFSLGVILYEMAAGRAPFIGTTASDVVAAILTSEPTPLGDHRSDAPRELEWIVGKCLEKERERRYQAAQELLFDLKQLKRALESGATVAIAESRAKRPRLRVARHWTWAALPALLALLLLAVFFAWQRWRVPQDAEPLRAAPFTTLPGVERSPSLSPDGNYVASAWTGPKQGNPDIYVQQIGSGDPVQRTTDTRSDYNPVWSPDGKWIAFFRSEPPAPTGVRNRELLLIPPLGGPERKLADIKSQDFIGGGGADEVYLAWSADSSSLIVTDSTGDGKRDALFVVSLATGEKRQLTNPPLTALADTSPAVSPDGQQLVFLRRTSWGAGELQLLPLGKGLTAAGEPGRLTPAKLGADYPAWMPDGKEIIFSAKGGLWRLSVAGENIPTRIPYVGADGVMPTISRAEPGKPARLVYVHSFADANFWRIDTSAPGAPATSLPTKAIASTKSEYHCQFSPNGRRVVFSSGRSGEQEIWVSDPDGANAIKLTSLGAVDTNCPCWSPDGKLIAFSSTGESEFDVYVVPAAGGKLRRLTSHPAMDLCPTFSRDGKWIYFHSKRAGDYRVWKMPADGGEAVMVATNQSGLAFESLDGSNLYYLTPSIVSPVYRLPTAGGEPVKVLDGVVWFNFCLLKDGAYYIDRVGSDARLQYLSFLTGKSTNVAHNLGEVWAGLTATPDGKTILFTRFDSSVNELMLVENFR